MINAALFSSASAEWETPPELFAQWDRVFRFNLDVCATEANAKCPIYITPEADGLVLPWVGRCWMNPPYGRGIGAWTAKAKAEAEKGALVVGLLPARTDTRWWHRDVVGASVVRFLPKRLTFVGAPHTAPFPSVVVVWGLP